MSAYADIEANLRGEPDTRVDNQSTFRSKHRTPTSTDVIKGCHEDSAEGHGALGATFAGLSSDVLDEAEVRMDDSPTVLRLLSSDRDDSARESWGGKPAGLSDQYRTENVDPRPRRPDRHQGRDDDPRGPLRPLNGFAQRFH